jgi:SAM-dependent methyltransferase
VDRPFYYEFAWAYDLIITGPVESRIDFVVEQLSRRGIQPTATLLDAGCGSGRYAIALAKKGFEVTGIDISEELISHAESSQAAHLVRFRVGDILNLKLDTRVDAVLCRGVLNDLTDDTERRKVFFSFANYLRRGGVLILDAREWHATAIRITNEPIFERVVETERGRLSFTSSTTLLPESRSLAVAEVHVLESCVGKYTSAFDFTMRCWTRPELQECLENAGFTSIEYYGDYDITKAPGSTDRLVVVASNGRG